MEKAYKNYYLSNYRTAFMGFSIIWVMLFHLGISDRIINCITRFGYLGVDIFLFLSSYGLYYSIKKDSSITHFYKKRFLRILPSYYIVLLSIFIITCLYSGTFDLIQLFEKMSFLGYFIPSLEWPYFLWYIPAILFLYSIFPLLYKNLEKLKEKRFLLPLFILLTIINFLLTDYIFDNNYDKGLILLIPRTFIFILGLIWADVEYHNIEKVCKHKTIFILLFFLSLFIILICDIFLTEYTIRFFMFDYITFIFGIAGIFIIWIFLYNIFPNVIKKIIIFSGSHSLELYCIHESLYTLRTELKDFFNIPFYLSSIILFLVSFILAYLLKKNLRCIFNDRKSRTVVSV